MKIFNNQLELTMYWEGFKSTAYRCPAGVITIGFGSTRDMDNFPIKEGEVWTLEQAKERLEFVLDDALRHDLMMKLNRKIFLSLSEEKTCSLLDYAYNAGINAFPTLIKKLNIGDMEGASLEFLDSIYVAKKPLLGLLLRRISEYNTFTTGQYIAWEKGDPISQDLKDKLLSKNAKNQDAVNMINQFKVK